MRLILSNADGERLRRLIETNPGVEVVVNGESEQKFEIGMGGVMFRGKPRPTPNGPMSGKMVVENMDGERLLVFE